MSIVHLLTCNKTDSREGKVWFKGTMVGSEENEEESSK